ncbi:MAG TPA: DUF2017 domain-containing protein [Acidimicrobiales bacterium]
MSGFRVTAKGITIKLDASDARLLADLANQVAALIAGRGDTEADAALDRLLPAAYRGDDASAAEFRRFTEDELADGKVLNALTMVEALQREPIDGHLRVTLDAASAQSWLRSLTDIRLALASRLGLEDPATEPPHEGDDRYLLAVYTWLGGLQWSLVRAVDR